MIKKLLPILVLFSLSINQVKGQASTTSVVPLLSCTVTTFSCPGVSGCCTIGGCCGSGCCMNGYTCINEGTSKQTCCPASDPTKCGTVTPSSGSGPGSGSGDKTCTTIHNCPRDPVRGLAWTCLLGKTCGLSYNQCNACPYIASGSDSSGGSSGTDSSGSGSGPSSSSASPSRSTPSSGTDSSRSGSSSLSSSASPTGSTSSSGSGPSSSSSSSTSSGRRSRDIRLGLHVLAAVGVGSVLAIAV